MMNVTRNWQTPIRHRSVVLGAILISLVWMALSFFLSNEHDSAERAAIQNSTNLAGAFEEHLSRSLSEIDRSLKIIRTLQARDAGKFKLADWLKSNRVLTNDVLQIALVDREANVKVGGVEGEAQTLSASRLGEAYKAHVDTPEDRLFIGKPVLDPATGRWSLQFSRRINDSHGLFNGVIVAALDPAYLTRIYNSINIGKSGYIRVVGLDGAVRATSGRTFSILEKDFSGSDLIRKLSVAPDGWFYTSSSLSDNVRRLIAYRSVTDYPLVITVGLAAHEIFARLEAQRRSGYLVAAALSLIILVVTGFSVRGQLLRDAAKKRLEHANMLLNATLANMPHGICMFGADKRLVLANDLYSTMYGLDPNKMKPGTTLPQILEARVASGCCPLVHQ
jgi:two-component system sensor histidine kinase BarA